MVLENFKAPFDRVSTFKKILAAVPGLKLHLDFGHTNFGLDKHEVFCRELGEHIQHVHFSDNRSKADDHIPLGVGTIDWKNAVDSLKTTGYDGTISLEVFCSDPDMQYSYLDMSRQLVLKLLEIVLASYNTVVGEKTCGTYEILIFNINNNPLKYQRRGS